jgi:large subunit ribosomal protein L2
MQYQLYDTLLWRHIPVHKLTSAMINSSGRNNRGRITAFHRGGGAPRRYRVVDFRRRFYNIPAIPVRFERDPNRSAPLCLLCYSNGVLSYILGVRDLSATKFIYSGSDSPLEPGNALPLSKIPIGYFIHNVGGSYIRGNGQKAQILRQTNNMTVLRMPSQEIRSFVNTTFATIGTIQKSRIL